MRSKSHRFLSWISSRYDLTDNLTHSTKADLPTKDANGEHVNLFGLYMVIGLGAEYNLGGNTSLVGSLTFNNGFVNAWKTTGSESFNDVPAYVALNLGVVF